MTNISRAALDCVIRGYIPLPIKAGSKAPHLAGWTTYRVSADEVEERWAEYEASGATNLGVALGAPSGGLVDVDIDHPAASRLRDFFLPPTAAVSGRAGRPYSHYWYRVDPDTLPTTRRHKMPDGQVSVELRTTGAQTVIPPSIHPSGEEYRWESEPWGGDEGPSEVDARALTVQVALLALGAVLIEVWPRRGSRHDAYLALAGGLLRYGDGLVHPYWERNAPVLISALAEATADEDGGDSRVSETMSTTLKRLSEGKDVVGFPRLAELIGDDSVRQARVLIADIEQAAGFTSRNAALPGVTVASPAPAPAPPPLHPEDAAALSADPDTGEVHAEATLEEALANAAQLAPEEAVSAQRAALAGVPLDQRDPLSERLGTWQTVDLEPYLFGGVRPEEPSVFRRADGKCLMYPGRLNMLFGSSESAKSWIALQVCLQEMSAGQRVMYLDFEDEPVLTLSRLRMLGAGTDDVRLQFSYVRPEEPLAPMQRNRNGTWQPTDRGRRNAELLAHGLETVDPSLVVVDGMTMLYGLHGLDTNDSASTDVITTWLKSLTRNGRSTVLLIDHAAKHAERGSLPIGSQHKVSMVQGSLLQVWPVAQPMPGAVGEVDVIVLKDRPGQVRAVSAKKGAKAQVAARILLDSTDPSGAAVMTIEPPRSSTRTSLEVDLTGSAAAGSTQRKEEERKAKAEREAALRGRVLGILREAGEPLSKLAIYNVLHDTDLPTMGSAGVHATHRKRLEIALDSLLGDRAIVAEGSTRDRVFRIGGTQPESVL